MNYFVLFSVLLIAASVVILLFPSPGAEGFTTRQTNAPTTQPMQPMQPMAAGQRNASNTAGTADGISNNQHLLDTMLKKHDKLAEAFENREKPSRPGVSATTTKKKGIASTGASYKGDEVTVPTAGCNKDKCVEIGKTQSVFDPMAAIDGNCVNPTLPNGEPDYSIKYCAAFQPKDYTIDAQECLTCGYYGYTANCLKYADPNDPNKCTLYGDYKFQKPTGTNKNYLTCDADNANSVCKLLAGGGQGQGDQGSSGPSCSASTCGQKTVTVDGTQCIIPGCVSNDGGMMPYPNDFYGNPSINPCYPTKDGTGATNGFMCPPITSGEMYDSGGGSSDLCYTSPDPDNPKSNIIDRSKFVKIDTVCSNDRPKSKQQFKPENVDGNDDADGGKRTASKTGATTSAIQHQHRHGGAINVYHHHMNSSGSTPTNQTNQNNNGNGNNQGYMEPEAGASVLGFL